MTDTIRLNALRAYALGQFDNPDLLRFGPIAETAHAQILHVVEMQLNDEVPIFHDLEILDLRDEIPAEFPKGRPWMVVNHDNIASFHSSESEARAIQRAWRTFHGRDEMTGL